MIQRIQSIFLLLAGLCFGAMFLLPMAISNVGTGVLMADASYDVMDHVALIALSALGGLLSLAAIFLFKNRGLQMRLGYIVIIAAILLCVMSILFFMQEAQTIPDATTVNMQFGIGLPILAIVFAFLANRFIKKDETLVKSMDRLR